MSFFSSPVVAILATGVARLFDLSQKEVFVEASLERRCFFGGGSRIYFIIFSPSRVSIFLSIALLPRRRVSSANPGRTALVVSLKTLGIGSN